MRFIAPYHKGSRLQRGGQTYAQRGAGFGSILKTIFSNIAPMVMKGVRALTSMGHKAAQNPEIRAAMKDIQSKAISEGVKYVNRVLTPKEQQAQKEAIKRQVEKSTEGTVAKKKKKKSVKKPAVSTKKKKKKKQVGRGLF